MNDPPNKKKDIEQIPNHPPHTAHLSVDKQTNKTQKKNFPLKTFVLPVFPIFPGRQKIKNPPKWAGGDGNLTQ